MSDPSPSIKTLLDIVKHSHFGLTLIRFIVIVFFFRLRRPFNGTKKRNDFFYILNCYLGCCTTRIYIYVLVVSLEQIQTKESYKHCCVSPLHRSSYTYNIMLNSVSLNSLWTILCGGHMNNGNLHWMKHTIRINSLPQKFGRLKWMEN